jgi:hypothetical protein
MVNKCERGMARLLSASFMAQHCGTGRYTGKEAGWCNSRFANFLTSVAGTAFEKRYLERKEESRKGEKAL